MSGRVLSLRRLLGAVAITAALLVLVALRPPSLGGSLALAIVSGRSMHPALEPGDLVVVRRRARYGIGDVVDYHIPSGPFRGRQIIHRVVGGDAASGFELRGDNKPDSDLWRPRPSDVVGRQWVRVPFAGRVLVLLRAPAFVAAAAAGAAFAYVYLRKSEDDDRQAGGEPPQEVTTEG